MGDDVASSSGGGGGGGETVVTDHGARRGPCGYCRSPGYTSLSHGLWAESLTVYDYQDLLDRGWRRSGSYIYKPDMARTCCPSYTIRLNVEKFVPSKEQIRVHKKMQRFLAGKLDIQNKQLKSTHKEQKFFGSFPSIGDGFTSASNLPISKEAFSENFPGVQETNYVHCLSKNINDAVTQCFGVSKFPSIIQFPEAIAKKVTPQAKRKLKGLSEDLLYTSNISFHLASMLRRLGSLDNYDSEHGELPNGANSDIYPSRVAERLADAINKQGGLPGYCVKACNGHLNFYSTNKSCEPEFVKADSCSKNSKSTLGTSKRSSTSISRTVVAHKQQKLQVVLKRSSFDLDEFALYRKYQIKVHNDKPEKVTERSYRRFLVDTPLIYVPPDSSSRSIPLCGFGSFHQQYIIEGKLVAVGVVDVLPKCLSSKYLFWDPDFAPLSLGKYSALQEINWVKEAKLHCSSLQYYYLGYYIHSCSKMRYKAAYRPSELLCPLRYRWIPYDIAKLLLDERPYVILSDFAPTKDEISLEEALVNYDYRSPECSSHGEDSGQEEDAMDLDFADVDASIEDESGSRTTTKSGPDDPIPSDVINNIVLDLNGFRIKFKDIQELDFIEKRHIGYWACQLHRYVEVVGKELSGRMIYSLN